MGAYAECLGHALTTAATVLAGRGSRHGATERPAHAALKLRMDRDALHPTSLMLFVRWLFLTMLAVCKSS
jgi:hypothetical protein